jgi:cell division transport system ATP-binding protein
MVLADEPTGNLDPALAIDILGLFEEIHAQGTTVLFATHDRTLLDVRPRRVIVLDEGRVTDVPAGLPAWGEEAAVDGFDEEESAPRALVAPTKLRRVV